MEKAKLIFEEVMSKGGYSLITALPPKTDKDYIFAFQSNFAFTNMVTPGGNVYQARNNKESVWEIQFSDGVSDNPWLPGWQAPGSLFSQYFSPMGYKNIAPTKELAENVFESVSGAEVSFQQLQWDPRRYVTVWEEGDIVDYRAGTEYNVPFEPGVHSLSNTYINRGYGMAKYNSPVYTKQDGSGAPGNAPINWRMIRYADVLLMYAEVCLKLGVEAEAQDEFDMVRSRAGMKTAPLTISSLIKERDRELAGECIRFHDIIRWSFDTQWESECGSPESLIKGFTVNRDEFLPIPLADININKPAYVQNSGW